MVSARTVQQDTAMNQQRLYLLGLRGSGKSTLGRRLAASMRCGFVDLDDVTARVLKAATPADALRLLGEPAFREGEAAALREPDALAAGVVALGGGTPAGKRSAQLLADQQLAGARLIYLRAEARTLRDRLAATDLATRPSLTGADPLVEIEVVHARRDPLYLEIADDVLQVDGMSEDEALAKLVQIARE